MVTYTEEILNVKCNVILFVQLVLSIICSQCGSKDGKIFKEVESIEILKILDLIFNIEEYQNKYDRRKHRI